MTAVAAIIIISNLPPVSYFLQEEYHYQNKDGSFNFTEISNIHDFEVCKRQFESYISKNPHNSNKILYRKFTLKPWRFWEWWQMIAHFERFNLPYLRQEDQ